jgi:hypothetical protein
VCKCLKYGGQGRNRTADASLFRAALYQLSYLAITDGLHTCSFGGTVKTLCVRNDLIITTTSEFTQTRTGAPRLFRSRE